MAKTKTKKSIETSTETLPETPVQNVESENLYQVTVSIGTEIYKSAAADLAEALSMIKPRKVTTKVLVKVIYGDKSFEKNVPPRIIRRVFVNKLVASVFSKNIKLGLK